MGQQNNAIKIGVPDFFDCSGVPGCSGVFRCSGVPGFSTCRGNAYRKQAVEIVKV